MTRPLRPIPPRAREVVVDTETTGLSPRAGHRIVSVSLIEVIGAEDIGPRLDLLVDPGRPIPAEASAIHGIHDADVRGGAAPPFAAVAAQIAEFIGDRRLVGYNLGFDLGFLSAEFARCGTPPPPAVGRPGLDLMALVQRARPGPRRRLRAACDELGLALPGLRAHSARDDATAAALLYIALRSRHGPLHWDLLVRGAEISIAAYREKGRCYEDDDLQAAWELFQAKDYDAALAHALAAVARDEGRRQGEPDPLGYELACMILRRRTRLDEELDLLWRYFRRRFGPEVTAERIVALAATPPWELGIGDRVVVASEEDDGPHPRGLRPRPDLWEMAVRFARVTERLSTKHEANGDRLARALAALPGEAAYEETAVCLRKEIAELVRARQDIRGALLRLHKLAQQHAFLYSIYRLGWDHPANKANARAGLYGHVVAGLASEAELEQILLPYDVAGYRHLPLLKRTDIRRLVGAFGEPATHTDFPERYTERWEAYRRAARRARRQLSAVDRRPT